MAVRLLLDSKACQFSCCCSGRASFGPRSHGLTASRRGRDKRGRRRSAAFPHSQSTSMAKCYNMWQHVRTLNKRMHGQMLRNCGPSVKNKSVPSPSEGQTSRLTAPENERCSRRDVRTSDPTLKLLANRCDSGAAELLRRGLAPRVLVVLFVP